MYLKINSYTWVDIGDKKPTEDLKRKLREKYGLEPTESTGKKRRYRKVNPKLVSSFAEGITICR